MGFAAISTSRLYSQREYYKAKIFYPWIWNSSLLCHYHALYGKHFFDTWCINSTEYKEELVLAKNFVKLKSLFLFQCQRVWCCWFKEEEKRVLFIGFELNFSFETFNLFLNNHNWVSNPWKTINLFFFFTSKGKVAFIEKGENVKAKKDGW